MATAIVSLLIYCASDSRALGQQPAKPLRQPPGVIKYDGDMTYILAKLPEIYDVTIGLEVDPRQPSSRASFFLQDPTLPDVLNAIVKSAPNYQWRDRNGCFEILPVKATNPLLDIVVKNYRVNEVNQTDAVNHLLNLPDFQTNSMGRLLQLESSDAQTATKLKRFSLSLDGVTMREALSRIADESGTRFWIFRPLPDGSFSIGNIPR